jgi:hypothetical protein
MKNRKIRLRKLIGIGSKLGERFWTRLYPEDQSEVLKRVSESNPPAQIIRELVSKGLKFECLQANGRDNFVALSSTSIERSVENLEEDMALIKRILSSLYISTAAGFDFPLDQSDHQFVNRLYSLCFEQINLTLKLLTAPQQGKASEKLARNAQSEKVNTPLTEREKEVKA